MTPENFCYWLQGFVEIHGGLPDEGQWYMIKEHLQHVFDKKTKSKEDIDSFIEKLRNDHNKQVDCIGKNPDPSYWQYPQNPLQPFQPTQIPTITC